MLKSGSRSQRGENEIGSGDMPPEAFELMQKKSADNVFFTARGQIGVFFVVKQIKPPPLTGEPATATRQAHAAQRGGAREGDRKAAG